MKKQELEKQIEVLRMKMYQCYQNDNHSEEVLKISQQLDQLLNQSYKLSLKRKVM
ncbi:aspartyl-phosphate phosphatase Spo0E family protein [Aquibacillus albus]|uniref:Spo0E family sporulation regulatory protein-aspartic acid phosphatase n=1 Tax=Aquibacillus albus TaxID=1168171 RepID=A0ABS2MWT9_9BACI|nr:aspartyl-phosphate phosphatase Spo0E family protein [Aquibacillus albus]MBM7570356.1 hypothetical protein [Aquibacillus albus]